jgi:hypothetical protein
MADSVDAAWQRFCLEHIQPSAIFSIAVGIRTPTYEERNHLEKCMRCRSALHRYRRNSHVVGEDQTG